MRRFGVGIAALLALGFAITQPSAPAAAEIDELPPETMVDWSEAMTDWTAAARSYTFGDLTLAITTKTGPDDIPVVMLTASTPGEEDVSVTADGGYSPYGQIGIYEFEPGKPTILFTVYSGGAHCCMQTSAVTLTDSGFVVADVGYIDGDTISPSDIDGDGAPELVLYDDRFNYAFSAYAFSRPAQRVFQFVDGEMVDVTREEKYADYQRRYLDEISPGCGGEDGWLIAECAGYLATAALLGTFEEEFPKVEAAWKAGKFDPESGWTEFTWCLNDDCSKTEVTTDFPQALLSRLTEWGYLDAAGQTPGGADPIAPGAGTDGGKDKLNAR
jgi:hypothetical protein